MAKLNEKQINHIKKTLDKLNIKFNWIGREEQYDDIEREAYFAFFDFPNNEPIPSALKRLSVHNLSYHQQKIDDKDGIGYIIIKN